MHKLFLFTACLLCGGLHAQGDDRLFRPQEPAKAAVAPVPQDTARQGRVHVEESSRIQAMMADYAAKKRVLKGYRVQIFLGDRAKAETTRRTFLQQHPDVPAYLSYLAPNFRVRVGDLRDRVSADALRQSLKAEFPGLYIVPDDIEPPALMQRTGAAAP